MLLFLFVTDYMTLETEEGLTGYGTLSYFYFLFKNRLNTHLFGKGFESPGTFPFPGTRRGCFSNSHYYELMNRVINYRISDSMTAGNGKGLTDVPPVMKF